MKIVGLIIGVLLLSIIIFDHITIEKLSEELATAKITRKRNPIKFIKKDKARVKIFGFLYEINKDKKRIKYLPGELLVEDLELGRDDQFLDLLDFLFEQELLVMIEIPENKTIKEDLRLAGFSSEYITKSKDGMWRIKIKESLND